MRERLGQAVKKAAKVARATLAAETKAAVAKAKKAAREAKAAKLANDKAQDVTIKKLTRKNPTMAEKFRLLANEEPD